MTRLTRALAAIAVAGSLTLTGCAKAATDPVSAVPDFIDLEAIPADGGTGNGLEYLTGEAALAEVVSSVRAASWYSLSVTFGERQLATDENPFPVEHSYSATTTGSGEAFTSTLTMDGRTVDIYLREGMLLGYGEPTALADLGFAAVDGGPACLSASRSAAGGVLSLIEPDRLLTTLLANADNPIASVHTGGITATEGTASTIELGIASGEGLVGTLWANAAGIPYPQRLVIADPTGDITAEFGAWDTPGTLTEPANSAADC